MQFNINAKQLTNQLKKVMGALPSKGNPYDGMIRIMAIERNGIQEIYLETYSPKQGIGAVAKLQPESLELVGRSVVDAKKLFSILSGIGDKEIRIISAGEKLTMNTARGKYSIRESEANEYYEVIHPKTEGPKVEGLMKVLDNLVYAVSDDELRPSLSGIYFDTKNEHIVGTDGHRLVKADFTISQKLEPFLLNKCIYSQLKNFSGDVCITREENNIFFIYDDGHIYANVIKEDYPNYEAVIPKDYENSAKVSTEELRWAVQRLMNLTDYSTKKIVLSIKAGPMIISASDIEGNAGDEKIEMLEIDGVEMDIGFNGKYLLDALQRHGSDIITFEYATPMKAVMFRHDIFLNIIMPVRLGV